MASVSHLSIQHLKDKISCFVHKFHKTNSPKKFVTPSTSLLKEESNFSYNNLAYEKQDGSFSPFFEKKCVLYNLSAHSFSLSECSHEINPSFFQSLRSLLHSHDPSISAESKATLLNNTYFYVEEENIVYHLAFSIQKLQSLFGYTASVRLALNGLSEEEIIDFLSSLNKLEQQQYLHLMESQEETLRDGRTTSEHIRVKLGLEKPDPTTFPTKPFLCAELTAYSLEGIPIRNRKDLNEFSRRCYNFKNKSSLNKDEHQVVCLSVFELKNTRKQRNPFAQLIKYRKFYKENY